MQWAVETGDQISYDSLPTIHDFTSFTGCEADWLIAHAFPLVTNPQILAATQASENCQI
jgi:hypothetical protein